MDTLTESFAAALLVQRRDTELVIARHGEAVVNLQPNRDGRCLGLTERGRVQAGLLAARLAAEAAAGRGFDAAYHSTRERCAETAGIVAAALGMPIEPCEALRNSDHGALGVDPWIIAENSIGTIPPLAPDREPTPGGESWQHFLDRSGAALLEIIERHPGGRILVIAHSETQAAAFHAFARLSPGASRWFFPQVDHTALCVWRRVLSSQLPGHDEKGAFMLLSNNDRAHLEDSALVP